MSPPPQARRPLDPQLSHPLDQLRGTIRRYVVLEGALSAAIFLALWFTLGLIFDFGMFKIATWDWALDAPWWFRLVALIVAVGLLLTILSLRILTRLTTEFSYRSLALVLERRFPKVFGDRLITAVELADLDRQARYGYSREMLTQTFTEARERVGTVPVRDVFNWRRLRVLGMVAGGLVIGIVLSGFVCFIAATGSADPYQYGWRFAHVTATYLDRNLLLHNTPWPRRAHLELVQFPGEELRVGKDAPDPVVRAKAYRWVIADRTTPLGWRPMVWGDVTESLIHGPVPQLPEKGFRAAADTGVLPDDMASWSVDQIQSLGRDDANARTKLAAALHPDESETLNNALERVFGELEARAASPSMGGRLRKLDLPEKVSLSYSGQTLTGEVTLSPLQNQEFAAPVPELKESIRFVVRAEDFRTPSKTITLVPQPVFTRLIRTEFQPAYLHHAPPAGEGYPALQGLRQMMGEQALSLTGDRSVISVPSGTEMVLTATADVDLAAAYVQPKVGILPGAKPGSSALVPVSVGPDKRTVSIEFRGNYRFAAGRTFNHTYTGENGVTITVPVTTTPTVEFDIVIEQGDGVRGRRQLLVQVVDDQPPTVELAVDVIRKVGSVYYVTPRARVPFNPESSIRDDHGLSKVAFEVLYWPEDSDLGRALRAQLLSRPFLSVFGPVSIATGVVPTFHAVKFKDLDKGDNRKTASFGLKRFEDARADLRPDTREVFESRLKAPFTDTFPHTVQRVDLKSPEVDFFDVNALKLEASVSEVQTRFRLDLNIVATDTNYDTGPKTGQNSEPIRLLVVSEGDLLAEINKEEEGFANRLDEALVKIAGAKKWWEYVRNVNAAGIGTGSRDNLDTVRVRAQEASQLIAKARDTLQTVVREYRRIHRECIVNQVIEVTRDRFGTFGNRIDRVLGENPPPVNEEESRQLAAGRDLIPKTTFTMTEKQLDAVLAPLGENRWADAAAVSDAEIALNLLEQEILKIRAALGEIKDREKLKRMLAAVIEEKKRLRQELERWQQEKIPELTKKEPDILPIGAVFLTKGESKKLKQGINWRQFDKDDLTIKVTVLDKDKNPVAADVLVVPAQIKLDFEKNNLDFEYMVKAGVKEGEYTMILTPEVGVPVLVTVTIK